MRLWFSVVIAAMTLSCRSAPGPASSAARVAPSQTALAAPVGTGASPQAELARLDQRRPVPLLAMMANHQKRNMRDHLAALQDIVQGIAADDFNAIEKASKRIGYSQQMGVMCTHMGAAAPGFTERALAFHHTADEIGEAARSHDMKAVLLKLNETMKTCTGCHAIYKQQVVDEATWARLASHASSQDGGAHDTPQLE